MNTSNFRFLIDFIILYSTLKVQRDFVKLVAWEQLATQGVPRRQVHKRVAGGSQRRGSVASPV
ncbi:hypothetical protein DW855_12090 [Faecalibacterium prausnitzii]|uniref:Uncharacterized protein n=1 Tax=Faecalibacterium prausnitzii TaxID=853 RepID=A0A3E2VYH8_9FIRM|nr:hypothetical protein DW855_12090 [Faecalibacterium prausnitzii]RHS60689.1 hypothetical protein DW954_17895 [Clostridium sp. AM45-5]RHS78369.1 hypothetical protein DW953_01410 [Ruminococcus sp. AM45-2]